MLRAVGLLAIFYFVNHDLNGASGECARPVKAMEEFRKSDLRNRALFFARDLVMTALPKDDPSGEWSNVRTPVVRASRVYKEGWTVSILLAYKSGARRQKRSAHTIKVFVELNMHWELMKMQFVQPLPEATTVRPSSDAELQALAKQRIVLLFSKMFNWLTESNSRFNRTPPLDYTRADVHSWLFSFESRHYRVNVDDFGRPIAVTRLFFNRES